MTVNKSSSPYYDDFDTSKNFLQILFRPGYAIQARELSQIQSILQAQIKAGNDFLLKNGTPVSGGLASYDNNSYYLRLKNTDINGNSFTVSDYDGKIITGATSGARAYVIHTTEEETNTQYSSITDPPTLYVNRINDIDFTAGEEITVTDDDNLYVKNESVGASAPNQGYEPFGQTSLVHIAAGIYYIDGYFVTNNAETITLNKYNTIPSCRVGLTITRQIIEESDDSSLLDPAIGSENESAPGAHRYNITLTAAKHFIKGEITSDVNGTTIQYGSSENETDVQSSSTANFIELIRIVDGNVKEKIKHPNLGAIENTLARRTFDESGNYTVTPFQLKLQENVSGTETKLSAALEAGKAYVKGYEFETISTRFINVDKARDTATTNNSLVDCDFGNYIYVTDYNGSFDITTMESVDLLSKIVTDLALGSTSEVNYECYQIGTARVRQVEYVSGTPGTDGVYKLFLFNTEMESGYEFKDVKSVVAGHDPTDGSWRGNDAGIGNCNIHTDSLEGPRLTGATLAFDTTTTPHSITDSNYGFVTAGFKAGQLVTVHDATTAANESGEGVGKVRYYTLTGVEAGRLYLSGTDLDTSEAGKATTIVQATKAKRERREVNNLLIPIPEGTIKTLSDQAYSFQKMFTGKSVSSGVVNLTAAQGERFYDPSNTSEIRAYYQMVDMSDGTVESLDGATFTVSVGAPGGDDGVGQLEIDLNNAGLNFTCDILCRLYHVGDSASEQKGKTLVRNNIQAFDGASGRPNPNTTVNSYDYLGISDVIQLKAVYDSEDTGAAVTPSMQITGSTGTWTAGETVTGGSSGATGTVITWDVGTSTLSLITDDTFTDGETVTGQESGDSGTVATGTFSSGDKDITNRYELDTGQRDNFYDHAKIRLKKGQPAPKGKIAVVFDYFSHAAGNGYFSVDSYPTVYASNGTTVVWGYDDVPKYRSAQTGETFFLQDYLDFRPVRVNVGHDDSSVSESINAGSTAADNDEKTLNGIKLPVASSDFQADYEYYLNRIDKIVATKDKSFKVIKGNSAIYPIQPPDDKDSMTLYVIEVPAYTFNPSDVKVTYVENKRYTMRDIGRLEQRIENIEYFTQLNMIEKKATETVVYDLSGYERFKSGIIVDAFTGHGIGDVNNHDYKCSIDYKEGELRPPFTLGHNDLEYQSNESSSVQQTGDLITLPYSAVEYLNQPLKNTSVAINPFDIAKYVGTLSLSPSTDTFFDTSQRPDVLMNSEGDNDNYLAIGLDSDDSRLPGFGTKYNEELDIWVGQDTQNINESAKAKMDVNPNRGNIAKTNLYRDDVSRSTTPISKKATENSIKNSLGKERVEKEIGNRVLDTNIKPKIRTKTIQFAAKGLKPNTQVYAFFDETSASVTFTDSSYTALQTKTDSNGSIWGTFVIPEGAFRTGSKVFRLVDSSTNNLENATTLAEAIYFADGLLENSGEDVISTRPPIFRKEDATQQDVLSSYEKKSRLSGTVGSTTTVGGLEVFERSGKNKTLTVLNSSDGTTVTEQSVTVRDSQNTVRNPLAQTFIIDNQRFPSGIFVPSVTIRFASKDDNLPITLEIRPVVNGLPHASKVLPYAQKTLLPGQVTTSSDGSVETTFTFDSLVYLPTNEVGNEYAIVLTTDSKNYTVYVGESGENELSTNRTITKQPYVSDLYESNNTGEWAATPLTSLAFKVNRCKFTITSAGEAVFFNNIETPTFAISSCNVTTAGTGYTAGQVYSNSNSYDGSGSARISIAGGDGGSGLIIKAIVNAAGGFDDLEIVNVGSGYRSSPTITFDAPGAGTTAEAFVDGITNNNVYMDSFYIVGETLGFAETNTKTEIKTTTNGADKYSSLATEIPGSTDSYSNTFLNQKQYLSSQQKIIPVAGSLNLKVTLASGDDSVSPVVDEDRLAIIAVENLIGNTTLSTETAQQGGDALARYITRRISLEDGFEATNIKVYLTANKRSVTDIGVFIKTLPIDAETSFDEQAYTQLTQIEDSSVISEDANDYREYSYISSSELSKFKAFAIKLVLKSSDTTIVPKVKDVRAIAITEVPDGEF